MARTVSIGAQNFEKIRTNNYFYIDKTDFIRQWWESGDDVTLITRPRRFGKTLNMDMLEKFFSVEHAGKGKLFEGLSIWQDRAEGARDSENSADGGDAPDSAFPRKISYRSMQGTFPVIFLSFADVKETSFAQAREKMCSIIVNLYRKFRFLLGSDSLSEGEKYDFTQVSESMGDSKASLSLKALSGYLELHYGKKVLIFLDEYDTPMQEAYVHGYWEEMTAFMRSLFNSTFKTNPHLDRAIMTGITRISKESIFSDLNNLKVVTTTSDKYCDCFGFMEEEVLAALREYGLSDSMQQVRDWYDGFIFGKRTDIYNPWSITNFLDERRVGVYWANTSSNSLVGKLIREGSAEVKEIFEELLNGGILTAEIDEQIVFSQLHSKRNAIWSLFLASGYLKVVSTYFSERRGRTTYEMALTNKEVRILFESVVQDWFSGSEHYNDFIKALLLGDLEAMNTYMNRVAEEMFSSFDSGTKPSGSAPERFYHGFVLGLMVELADKYVITSNRESGFGRYDVMLEPRVIPDGSAAWQGASPNTPVSMCHDAITNNRRNDAIINNRQNDAIINNRKSDAIIIEFKVQSAKEDGLADTVQSALRQIEEMDYQAGLVAKGIPREHIRKYGFAFCGKKVLIGT